MSLERTGGAERIEEKTVSPFGEQVPCHSRMKFEKRFFFSVIPEWKDQYIALEALTKQIEAIKNAALRLVQSVANIKSTTRFLSFSCPYIPILTIQYSLHSLQSSKEDQFWKLIYMPSKYDRLPSQNVT